MFDLDPWKPVLSALLLPPTPALLLALLGARVAAGRRRGLGFTLVALAVALLWLGSCIGMARWMERSLLRVPAALSGDELARLGRIGQPAGLPRRPPDAAIVVLGGGRRSLAREIGQADLSERSLARLRHGVWLARRTGLPLAFSGGVGWAQVESPAGTASAQAAEVAHADGLSEAAVAARVAREEFGLPLRWQEGRSRDTRENAAHTVALLAAAGVHEIVLVTHASHMPRSVRAFEQAAARAGVPMRVLPAPMGFVEREERPLLEWLPSAWGQRGVHDAAHEWVGLITGR